MKSIVNQRSYPLEIANTGQWVGPGETVKVSNELAESLCAQPDNWKAAASRTKQRKDGER